MSAHGQITSPCMSTKFNQFQAWLVPSLGMPNAVSCDEMDNGSELEIGEQRSNFSSVHFIHVQAKV